jgi:hypothetical protein
MKTAMQEWFDELKANYPYMANEIFDKGFNKYLEKEKEHMLDFGLYVKKNGWVGCKIEDLYEDYNNQNK